MHHGSIRIFVHLSIKLGVTHLPGVAYSHTVLQAVALLDPNLAWREPKRDILQDAYHQYKESLLISRRVSSAILRLPFGGLTAIIDAVEA